MNISRRCSLSLALLGYVGASSAAVAPDASPKTVLPEAPAGFEWRKIEQASDEFSTNKLDRSKWRDHITTWQGRPPAEFLPQNVSVGEGSLKVRTSTHPNPNEVYNIAGGAVSGKYEQTYGYFESRLRASKVKMSTTFWLHSDVHENPNGPCEQRHSIEIDILEAIGGWPTESWSNFMNSNTHYKPSDMVDGRCKGSKYLSKGYKHDTGYNLSDDFHTFGSWWVSPTQVHYYFDGERVATVNVSHERDKYPFDGPMSLRMVAETYDWQKEWIPEGQYHFPTAEELDDPKINTIHYDYVRSYEIVQSKHNMIKNAGFESKLGRSNWRTSKQNAQLVKDAHMQGGALEVSNNGSASQKVKVNKNTLYTLSAYVKNLSAGAGAEITVKTSAGQVLAKTTVASAQYSEISLSFNSANNKKLEISIENTSDNASVIDSVSLMAAE